MNPIVDNLLHWKWTKSLLFWIILSAGTMSECAFLVSSIWKSINATEHQFLLMKLTQLQTEQISYLATTAFVILPVCILPLGIVTVVSHVRTWIYSDKALAAPAIWVLLYGIPTATFAIIDVCIIANSNGDSYTLPPQLIDIRSVMAWIYGLTAIVFFYVGKEQEVDRLKAKDTFIDELQTEIRSLKEDLRQSEIAQKLLVEADKNGVVGSPGAILDHWISYTKNRKTVSIEEINRITGVSKREIGKGIVARTLKPSSRNSELIHTSTVSEWLKSLDPTQTDPILNAVNS